VAQRFAQAGTAVVAGDLLAEAAERVAAEVAANGAEGVPVQMDVTKEEDAQRLVRTALDRFGRLDFLVCAAGNSPTGPVIDLQEEDWRTLIRIHLTGTFLCCRAAFDPIVASGGSVVTLASNYAYKGRVGGADYSAAKAGIVGFTKVLATELAPKARANVLAPGPVDTPRWRGSRTDEEHAARVAERVKDIPMGRMGTPQDIAGAVYYLCGPDASWVTGSILHINGGEYYA
jgi:3-oxoacyl-[acyl-carrier protein] reductase